MKSFTQFIKISYDFEENNDAFDLISRHQIRLTFKMIPHKVIDV